MNVINKTLTAVVLTFSLVSGLSIAAEMEDTITVSS